MSCPLCCVCVVLDRVVVGYIKLCYVSSYSQGRVWHTRHHTSECPVENADESPSGNPLGKWQSIVDNTTENATAHPLENAIIILDIDWKMQLTSTMIFEVSISGVQSFAPIHHIGAFSQRQTQQDHKYSKRTCNVLLKQQKQTYIIKRTVFVPNQREQSQPKVEKQWKYWTCINAKCRMPTRVQLITWGTAQVTQTSVRTNPSSSIRDDRDVQMQSAKTPNHFSLRSKWILKNRGRAREKPKGGHSRESYSKNSPNVPSSHLARICRSKGERKGR